VSNDEPRLPLVTTLYQEYLDHQDSVCFVAEVSRVYSQNTLVRLAEHDAPQVRRSVMLALGFLGDYEVNHVMGRALIDCDRTTRILAENGIRNVWIRAGTDEQQRQLRAIVRLNSAQRFEDATRRAEELIEKAPWYAEAWNQRAIAHFGRKRYPESVRDCHQVLEVNPYHFAAAAGMGHAYLELGDCNSALECFRRALRLNPDLEGVRVQVARLARMVEGKQPD
jgi:tetratricopeptide (TPR) repeat protein